MSLGQVVTLRDVGADLSRPTPTDRLIRCAQDAADSIARALWLLEYRRAERRYWPTQGAKNECQR